ncbi:uncharacterized protein TNIN_319801 [Trichonephila inaurata madagascariensis]|uniref:Uncharacterized protein n=1 Tax=Trichonephila inaurata madagascariensis TaxID=2747483 RepID=A0A8X6IEH1_9ARAC|nr:uncharacterized protein TNIN_319801 [Trichonephila inaurata madagascariensis]
MIRKALFWYKRFQGSVPGQIQHFQPQRSQLFLAASCLQSWRHADYVFSPPTMRCSRGHSPGSHEELPISGERQQRGPTSCPPGMSLFHVGHKVIITHTPTAWDNKSIDLIDTIPFVDAERGPVYSVFRTARKKVAVAEDPMSLLQSSIEEAQRNYDQGDVARYMLSQPIQQAQCHVRNPGDPSPAWPLHPPRRPNACVPEQRIRVHQLQGVQLVTYMIYENGRRAPPLVVSTWSFLLINLFPHHQRHRVR